MKDEVIVDGVRLTREQVERAYKQLNGPVQWEPQVGDHFSTFYDVTADYVRIEEESARELADSRWGSIGGYNSYPIVGVNVSTGSVTAWKRGARLQPFSK